MDDVTVRRRSRARFTAIAVGLIVVGVAGYVGFAAFVGSDRGVATGVMVLAAGTGFAAFFSPCSFPLLLTFLSRRSADSPGAALVSALRVAGGAALLLSIVALAMISGAAALGAVVEFDSTTGRVFRAGVGLVLIALGMRQTGRWRTAMGWLDRIAGSAARTFDPQRTSGLARRDVVYGFGYLLAGFG